MHFQRASELPWLHTKRSLLSRVNYSCVLRRCKAARISGSEIFKRELISLRKRFTHSYIVKQKQTCKHQQCGKNGERRSRHWLTNGRTPDKGSPVRIAAVIIATNSLCAYMCATGRVGVLAQTFTRGEQLPWPRTFLIALMIKLVYFKSSDVKEKGLFRTSFCFHLKTNWKNFSCCLSSHKNT